MRTQTTNASTAYYGNLATQNSVLKCEDKKSHSKSSRRYDSQILSTEGEDYGLPAPPRRSRMARLQQHSQQSIQQENTTVKTTLDFNCTVGTHTESEDRAGEEARMSISIAKLLL